MGQTPFSILRGATFAGGSLILNRFTFEENNDMYEYTRTKCTSILVNIILRYIIYLLKISYSLNLTTIKAYKF